MTKEELENQIAIIENDVKAIVVLEGYCSIFDKRYETISQHLSNCLGYLEKGLKINGKSADDGAIDKKITELNSTITKIRVIKQHILIIKNHIHNLESSLRTQLAGVKNGTE